MRRGESEESIDRTALINHLIEKKHYRDYLEIGVQNSKNNFNKVIVPHKEGVDPNVDCTYRMTSDEFFKTIPKDKKYDIIFIDGLHIPGIKEIQKGTIEPRLI